MDHKLLPLPLPLLLLLLLNHHTTLQGDIYEAYKREFDRSYYG